MKNIIIFTLCVILLGLGFAFYKQGRLYKRANAMSVETAEKLTACWTDLVGKDKKCIAQCEEELEILEQSCEIIGKLCIIKIESCEEELSKCLTDKIIQ